MASRNDFDWEEFAWAMILIIGALACATALVITSLKGQ